MVDCLFSFGLGLMLFVGFALLALTQFVHRRATGTAELPPAARRKCGWWRYCCWFLLWLLLSRTKAVGSDFYCGPA